jgi:hypothetical protein
MSDPNFAYIWRYSIKPEMEAEFLAAYESDGDWAKLFSRDANYIKTDLLHDSEEAGVYVTIDYWTSKLARDSFRDEHPGAFNELDERCEAYTVSEVFIGDFTINDTRAT